MTRMGLMSWNEAYKPSCNVGNAPSVPTMIHEEFFKNSISSLKASYANAMASHKEGWKKKEQKEVDIVVFRHQIFIQVDRN